MKVPEKVKFDMMEDDNPEWCDSMFHRWHTNQTYKIKDAINQLIECVKWLQRDVEGHMEAHKKGYLRFGDADMSEDDCGCGRRDCSDLADKCQDNSHFTPKKATTCECHGIPKEDCEKGR